MLNRKLWMSLHIYMRFTILKKLTKAFLLVVFGRGFPYSMISTISSIISFCQSLLKTKPSFRLSYSFFNVVDSKNPNIFTLLWGHCSQRFNLFERKEIVFFIKKKQILIYASKRHKNFLRVQIFKSLSNFLLLPFLGF